MKDETHKKTELFLDAKAGLMGIAYRMLGSNKDAEDIVQDVYIKLLDHKLADLQNPMAWMTTVCTRQCLDFIKSAQQSRTDYVGPWLPEPIGNADVFADERYMEISASLSTAFLLMLERLSAKERAVFLLREIFDHDYEFIAQTIDQSETSCRKIFSRAMEKIGKPRKRHSVDAHLHRAFFSAFKTSVEQGDISALKDMLSQEITLSADGGGKVMAALNTLKGVKNVSRFIEKGLSHYWQDMQWLFLNINEQPGAVIIDHHKNIYAAVTIDINDDRQITDIWVVRNPEKLSSLNGIVQDDV